MESRIFPAFRKAAILFVLLPIVLTGCSWYFYQSERVPDLMLYESFDDQNIYDRWDPWSDAETDGTAGDGTAFFAAELPGRIEVYGPRHYLTSWDTFVADYAVLLEWSVTNGDVQTQAYPLPIESDPDFTVRIDAIDTVVALRLYDGGLDTLEMYREDGIFLTDASVETAGTTVGTIIVEFEVQNDRSRITARVPELELEISDSVAVTDPNQDHPITVGASGLWSDPRALETVYVYRMNAGLEVFQ